MVECKKEHEEIMSTLYYFHIEAEDVDDKVYLSCVKNLDEAVDYYQRTSKWMELNKPHGKLVVEQTILVEHTSDVTESFDSIIRRRSTTGE